MPRGVKTDALTTKAIKLLKDELTALELATLFKVPRRTIYDVVRRIEQREWEERIVEEERIRREVERRLREKAEVEQERLEQDRLERDDGNLSVATLREGWERPSPHIRRFRS
jgi:sugar-specific transcriptional regulator TrmB